MTESNPPVVFSDETWVGTYPEFSPLTPQQGQAYFNRSCLQFANSRDNPAFSPCGNELMENLFYLLTSHIAWLYCPKDANGNPSATGTLNRLVGRVSGATEGSVNVQLAYENSGSPNEAYYAQTPYGLEFWNATANFRTARYLARPTVVINGVFPGVWNRGGFYRR